MMQRALITRDFSLAYVQQVGSATTPRLYNIAAMWSALEGSILLWVLILAGYTAAVGWRFRRRTSDPLVGWALVVMFVVMAFFALLSLRPGEPVRRRRGRGHQRTGPEPAAAEPRPRAVPPADPLPRLRRHDRAVRLRHRRTHHRPPRRGVAARRDGGRCSRGGCSRSASSSAAGGATRCSAGAACGRGTRWRTPACSRGSPPPPTSTRCSCRSVAGMLRVWNLSLLVATFALTILGTFITRSGRAGERPRLRRRPGRCLSAGVLRHRRRRCRWP